MRSRWNRHSLRFDNLSMRLFVGIPLAATVRDQLLELTVSLRTADDGLRWSRPESWHITLQFLGETEKPRFNCTTSKLRELRLAPVPVFLQRPGFFDHAGIFFAGVRLTPELREAQQAVTAATAQCGFIAESRPYQAHITLARGKDRSSAQSLNRLKTRLPSTLAFSTFTAHEFLLYESFLGAGGSRYEVRERFPLESETGMATS